MSAPRPLIIGNWKMHGLEADLDWVRLLAADFEDGPPRARVAVCPPATLVARAAAVLAGSLVAVGGQDCRPEAKGAFTGDISAAMLADAGASLVIVGHSERRAGHGESDADVAGKVTAVQAAGLEAVVCVGESLAERRSGEAIARVEAQVRASLPSAARPEALAIAYEPIWAIGAGLTPSLEEIGAVHDAIRAVLSDRFGAAGAGVPILYGGSVKPANAAEILGLSEVGGALVGGASLDRESFAAIIAAAA